MLFVAVHLQARGSQTNSTNSAVDVSDEHLNACTTKPQIGKPQIVPRTVEQQNNEQQSLPIVGQRSQVEPKLIVDHFKWLVVVVVIVNVNFTDR